VAYPFIAEIQLFGGNFAPRGWAFCDGELLDISQHTALFSLLGTIYGGDGRVTFALPDLRGRVPIQPGSGPGLPSFSLGEKAGLASIRIDISETPDGHTHTVPGATPRGASLQTSATFAESPAAGRSPGQLDNMQPYLALNYIIALTGVYPSRN
jgi:microcystin-dependent protein